MADNMPAGEAPIIHGSTLESAVPHISLASEKDRQEPPTLEHVQTNGTVDEVKDATRGNSLDALGIPDWQEKEKKIARRLDMTLLPQLWIMYMMNFC
jgi:hypothetical protein